MKNQEELRELPDKDLKERLDAEVIELNQLRINHTITPLDNSGLLREKRRNIACDCLIDYNTSGANETIFILVLRSSRATGPKIRLPLNSPALFSRTHALSSNRM